MPDWNVIKAEYVANPSASYRSLAEAHNVSLRTLARKASEEQWPVLRQQHNNAVATDIIDKNKDALAKRYKNFNSAADKLLRKISKGISTLEPKDYDGMRKLAAALKDMMVIHGITTETDNKTEVRISFANQILGEFAQ